MTSWIIERPELGLVICRADDSELYGPFESVDRGLVVAVAGRIVVEKSDWAEASTVEGKGGLACKYIAKHYQHRGIEGLFSLNGNFTVLVHDESKRTAFVITDRSGTAPVFRSDESEGRLVFASHPDLLAAATGMSHQLDHTSLGEFLCSGKVSSPYSYYKSVRACDCGTAYTISLRDKCDPSLSSTPYFTLDYKPVDQDKVTALSEELAEVLKAAVRRRIDRTRKTIVSLSGGLDSRTILAACPNDSNIEAICFLDDENVETRTAQRIAASRGVKLHLLHRKFDHYGDAAEAGVRISGGMASLASNHFLGFRESIGALGAGSLLTGCYCDYLFKGLSVNKALHWLSRSEQLAPFDFHWYRPHFRLTSALMADLESRWETVFPQKDRVFERLGRYRIEASRIFPFAYEPDNTQRMIPQRTMLWTPPIVDNDVLEIYLRTPIESKLNATMFSRMVQIVCGPAISNIPDSNTGAAVGATRLRVLYELYRRGLINRLNAKLRPTIATSGSWPNWHYYVAHSETIRSLWGCESVEAKCLFREMLGFDAFAKAREYWSTDKLELFLRLLTLMIWLRVRIKGPQTGT